MTGRLVLFGLQLAALVASIVALVAACQAERRVSALPDLCDLDPFCAEFRSYDVYGRKPLLDVVNVPFGQAKKNGPGTNEKATANVWSSDAGVHMECIRVSGPRAGKPCCEATKTADRYCTPAERAEIDVARPFWPKDEP